MHPEILRQLIEQRTRETQARVQEQRLSRIFRYASKRRQHGISASDYELPPIPDYVDGSFADSDAAGRVPAARDAA
jgi:hypothetical protein